MAGRSDLRLQMETGARRGKSVRTLRHERASEHFLNVLGQLIGSGQALIDLLMPPALLSTKRASEPGNLAIPG